MLKWKRISCAPKDGRQVFSYGMFQKMDRIPSESWNGYAVVNWVQRESTGFEEIEGTEQYRRVSRVHGHWAGVPFGPLMFTPVMWKPIDEEAPKISTDDLRAAFDATDES